MVHFGIICPAAPSHLNFMTTIGYELKQRGHRVTMVNASEAQRKAELAGLEFALIESIEFSAGVIDQKLSRLGKYSGWSALKATTDWIPAWVDTLLNQAPAVLKKVGVEALIIDQTSLEGGTIADILEIPFVNICNISLHQHYSTPPYWTPWRPRSEWWAHWRNRIGYQRINALERKTWQVITKYRQTHHLPVLSLPNDAFSKVAVLSQLPAEFDFPRTDLPDCFYYTGPFHNPIIREPIPFPYDKLTGQPLIYASLGTLQNQLVNIFQCIAAACADLEVQLVLSLGGALSVKDLPRLPGKPIVVDYAPQLELLQRAQLTITHAGMNTTLESLTQGVPMVAIPITNDQPGVAARIAWSGTGEVVPVARLNPKRLRRAIERVLYQPSYKANAVKIQQAIQRSGRTALASEIIERETSKAMIR
jgi:zeaxanthin glucosyltransferase